MSDTARSFPSNRIEALALAYVSKFAGEDTTPEDFCRKYLDAYSRISKTFREAREKKD